MLSAADRHASWSSADRTLEPLFFALGIPRFRRCDITGIGISLWLIHLHFIPEDPGGYSQTQAHTRKQPSSKLVSSPSLATEERGGEQREGSNPISGSPLSRFQQRPYRRLCAMKDRARRRATFPAPSIFHLCIIILRLCTNHSGL